MRRRNDDEVAVSNVLGAVLMFGLFVLTLVMIQTRFVPVWDRDREAEHMQVLGNQLGVLHSDMDRLVTNTTNAPITASVKLGTAGGFRVMHGDRLPGTLSLSPSASGGFRVSTTQARIIELNGERIFAGAEDWTQVVTGDVISNVGTVQNLRLRIANPSGYNTGDSVTISLTNATGAYSGKLVVTNINRGTASGGPTYSFRFETYAASSSTVPVSITEETFGKESPPAYQYFDLLRGELSFRQVLVSSSAPTTITLARNNIDASYTASYTSQTAGGGSTQVGSGGTLVPNFARTILSGRLSVESRNQRYIDQTYVLEHGAVLLSQPDGAAMFIPPTFAVSQIGGITDIRWVMPAINGAGATLSGPRIATLAVQPGTIGSFVASMPNLVVTIDTQYGAAWTQYWTTTLQSAGLTYGTQFTVQSTSSAATLTVFGQQSASGSAVDDLVLTFQSSTLNVVPRAGT